MVPIVTAYTGTCLANAPHTVAYSLQWIFGVKRCFVNIYGMSLHCQCFITVRGNAVKKKKKEFCYSRKPSGKRRQAPFNLSYYLQERKKERLVREQLFISFIMQLITGKNQKHNSAMCRAELLLSIFL